MDEAARTAITAGDIQNLSDAVEQLTQETHLLRTSLDELRDDVVWAARQILATGYQISGTPAPEPRDPLAPDSRPTVAEQQSDAAVISHAVDHADESAESAYCCDRPRLAWNGYPDTPGIMCENCGYIVAENGSVLIWRNEENQTTDNAVNEPKHKQKSLFS